MPEFFLKFKRRNTFLSIGEKCHCGKPIRKRKIASFHHCATAKSGSKFALFALVLPYALMPIMFSSRTFFANHAFLISNRFIDLSLLLIFINNLSG
jgi:hypothetical protein